MSDLNTSDLVTPYNPVNPRYIPGGKIYPRHFAAGIISDRLKNIGHKTTHASITGNIHASYAVVLRMISAKILHHTQLIMINKRKYAKSAYHVSAAHFFPAYILITANPSML